MAVATIGKDKRTDSKGRITLGAAFANQTFIVQVLDDGRVFLRPAMVVPAPEAWLFQNPKALSAVVRGLEQSAAGEIVESPPDLEDSFDFADSIEDD